MPFKRFSVAFLQDGDAWLRPVEHRATPGTRYSDGFSKYPAQMVIVAVVAFQPAIRWDTVGQSEAANRPGETIAEEFSMRGNPHTDARTEIRRLASVASTSADSI